MKYKCIAVSATRSMYSLSELYRLSITDMKVWMWNVQLFSVPVHGC